VRSGDLLFVHQPGLFPGLIRFGERLRHQWEPGAQWNHVAILNQQTAMGWTVVEATGSGVHLNLQSRVTHGGEWESKIVPVTGLANVEKVVRFVRSQIGARYGFLTIAAIVFDVLTPKAVHVDVRRDSTWICSSLAAAALLAGGWWPTPFWQDVYQVSPAELFVAVTSAHKEKEKARTDG